MTLDDIQASADTVMTAELLRLFKYADCDPTVCHACSKRIKKGDVFKLVPHLKPGRQSEDEMCCAKCGEAELVKRDKRSENAPKRLIVARRWDSGYRNVGGYSRPSTPR